MGILLLICITLCLALIDITLKSCIENSMTKKEERTACGGKVVLRKVYNKGVCMNLLEDKPDVVKYTSAYVAVLLTIYQLVTLLRKGKWIKKAGLSLTAAGAWSNTFDRWVRGYVIDYIGLETKKKECSRLTFNLGDFFIGAGGILLVLSVLAEGIKGLFSRK